jgi:hypothetical protein
MIPARRRTRAEWTGASIVAIAAPNHPRDFRCAIVTHAAPPSRTALLEPPTAPTPSDPPPRAGKSP